MEKKWEIAPKAPHTHFQRFPSLSPLLVQILYNRGLSDPAEVDAFMSGQGSTHDPLLLPDMDRAVDVLIRSILRKDRIAVYGDFDADGVTATALLVQTLTGLGADVIPYIPNRVEEGYGLNIDALRELVKRGVRLVVTVDCGIRALEEVNQARRGLEFIITDHHSVGPKLPFASAVINPKRVDSHYPFRDLSGVGVAYKLAQALIAEARTCDRVHVHIQEQDLLDLVAIGTVADLVPLLGENRYLVQQGLEAINNTRRDGIRALLGVSRVRPGSVQASSIGFGLAPRLNAAGRMDDAILGYELLVCSDTSRASQLARDLNEKNERRRALTDQVYAKAEDLAFGRGLDTRLLFAADETFQSGVVGLVAGRLTETYYRPSVIVERGQRESKGSCRSIPELHITKALDECGDLLVRYGGHAAAAGFTVRNDQLDRFVERLFEIVDRELAHKVLTPTLSIDADVPLSEMDWATSEWLQSLEPCGYANPTPLFCSRNCEIVESQRVGPEGRHLKLKLRNGPYPLDAIAFRMGDRASEPGTDLDVVYHLEVNEWNGKQSLQLNVQDLRPAGDSSDPT